MSVDAISEGVKYKFKKVIYLCLKREFFMFKNKLHILRVLSLKSGVAYLSPGLPKKEEKSSPSPGLKPKATFKI